MRKGKGKEAPPLWDLELEEGVLGSMMLSAEVCKRALAELTPADFGDAGTRGLFEVACQIGSAEPVELAHKASQAGLEARLPVKPYVHTLYHDCPRANPALVDRMVELRKRRAVADASDLIRKASESEDPETVLYLARGLLAPETSANGWKRFSARDLLTQEFDPIRWVVPSILAEGLCVFGGRPKARKSWMALQLAIAKATGGTFLGQQLEAAPVLYFALEDGPRRLADRLRDLECPLSVKGLTFQCGMPPIGQGGLEYVSGLVDEMRAEVVVIDTLSRAMDRGMGQGADQDRNADMTAVLNPFQRMALDRGLALVVIDHLRKRGEGLEVKDPVEGILGSTAKTGVADTIWGLYRRRGEAVGTLSVIGRDVEERDLEVRFDPTPVAWQLVGDLERERLSETENRYLSVVDQLGGEHVATESIAAVLGVTLQAARKTLGKLVRRGVLTCVARTGPKGGRFHAYSHASRAHARGSVVAEVVVPVVLDEEWWPGDEE